MVLEILQQILQPQVVLLSFLGTVFGIIVGAIPGLSGIIGISLLLPFTYKLSPLAGLMMLGGIYQGGMYGGAITAVLINVPGDVVATCTAIEGYQLTKKGRSTEALYYSVFASTFGGLLGVATLILFTPPLAKLALRFGPPETFLLGVLGLTVVGSLVGKNKWKSMFAVCLGLFISTIGMDPMSTLSRMSFGVKSLRTGISTVPLILGLFCIVEMIGNLGGYSGETTLYKSQNIKRWTVLKDILITRPAVLLKSSLIGIFIGILPGIGGSMAVFMSYAEAKRNSKNPEEYGHGSTEGIIAAESADNALVGGAMIPTLALGIPGSPAAAIIASALMMHGIVAGPDLFIRRPEVAYSFTYGMFLPVLFMCLIGAFCIKYFSLILKIKMKFLIPVVLVFAMFGAYSGSYNLFDVYAAIVIGLIGVILNKFEVPLTPVIVGAVLSSLIELNFRRTMQLTNAAGENILLFIIKRPTSLIILGIVLAFYIFLTIKNFKKRKQGETALGHADEEL